MHIDFGIWIIINIVDNSLFDIVDLESNCTHKHASIVYHASQLCDQKSKCMARLMWLIVVIWLWYEQFIEQFS